MYVYCRAVSLKLKGMCASPQSVHNVNHSCAPTPQDGDSTIRLQWSLGKADHRGTRTSVPTMGEATHILFCFTICGTAGLH